MFEKGKKAQKVMEFLMGLDFHKIKECSVCSKKILHRVRPKVGYCITFDNGCIMQKELKSLLEKCLDKKLKKIEENVLIGQCVGVPVLK